MCTLLLNKIIRNLSHCTLINPIVCKDGLLSNYSQNNLTHKHQKIRNYSLFAFFFIGTPSTPIMPGGTPGTPSSKTKARFVEINIEILDILSRI